VFPRKFLTFSFVTALAFTVLPLSVQIHAAVSGRPLTLFATGSKHIRHALLVGISKYGAFGDLAGGPLRDVSDLGNLLADKKYGFQVHTLPEKEATHDGIIAAFRKYLITDAEEGDVCLFFFSGHGTQINNTASPEEDKLDEALVPIDVKRPVTEKKDVKEIRDKELARLFNEALSKGVKLVIIIDSCHSGSIARGVNAAKVKKIDALMTVDMAVPPDLPNPIDPRNKEGKSPEERGALVMAAALDDESAEEHLYDGVYRGDFCKALLDVLRESDANKVSAEQLFLNVTARIRQDGRTQQHPTISKTLEARRRLTLFGDQPAGDPGQTEVTVVVDQLNETLTIQNGSDIGLTKGSEFKRKASPAVRIRVSEEVTELGRAVAEIVPPAKLSDIQTGDVFEQDKWAPAGKPNLKVWIPPAKLSAADLHAIAAELSKLRSSDRVQWVDDPTEEDVTHLISFDESGWQLVKLDGTIAKLGNQPTADAVLKLLPASGQSKLFVYLPPSIELRNKIKLGEGTQKSAIAVTRTRDEAVYLLVGRLKKTATETTVEYAWVLPAATQGEAHNSANSTQPNNKPPPESLPLPPLTTWIDGNAAVADHNPVTALEDMALRLGKIKGWLGLTSPPQERGHIFPYRLVIKNASQPNIEISNGSELVECEKYVVELVAEPFALNPLPRQRYVYVLGLDKSGNSSLLYGSGNESNRWPTKVELDSGTALQRILLDDAAFIVIGPKARCGINPNTGKPYDKGTLGNETYILLTTEDPLPLPELLEFKGVRSLEDIQAGKSRGDKSDLQDLLSSIYGPTMSTRGTTSLNWSVQQLTFRSVEKKP
jgi:hypothetical protein